MRFPLDSYCILKKLQDLTHLTLRGRAEKRNTQRSLEKTKRRHRNRICIREGWMSSPGLPHGIIKLNWKEYLGETRKVFLGVEWVNHRRTYGAFETLRAGGSQNQFYTKHHQQWGGGRRDNSGDLWRWTQSPFRAIFCDFMFRLFI